MAHTGEEMVRLEFQRDSSVKTDKGEVSSQAFDNRLGLQVYG